MIEKKRDSQLKIRILVWAINESKSLMEALCDSLIQSAKVFGIKVEFLGIGHKFIEHKQRIWILQNYLQTVPPNEIIVCMDGADTLFNGNLEQLLTKFLAFDTRILLSAEKDYTYQYKVFKPLFESIVSEYRYVNAGTFMGYAVDVQQMITEVISLNQSYPHANDQGLLGIWASLYLHQPHIMQLDTTCSIFWVTTHDWSLLEQSAKQDAKITNPNTASHPVIIHCVGNNFPPHRRAYNTAFRQITQQAQAINIIPLKIKFL